MSDFEKALGTFVEGCQKKITDYWVENEYKLEVPVVAVGGGRKYIKIVRGSFGSSSVHCFVNKENGDVLKSASWNAPAKIARGNIFNEDNGLNCMGQFGAAYLR